MWNVIHFYCFINRVVLILTLLLDQRLSIVSDFRWTTGRGRSAENSFGSRCRVEMYLMVDLTQC